MSITTDKPTTDKPSVKAVNPNIPEYARLLSYLFVTAAERSKTRLVDLRDAMSVSSSATVQKWINGDRTPPYHHVSALVNYLRMKPSTGNIAWTLRRIFDESSNSPALGEPFATNIASVQVDDHDAQAKFMDDLYKSQGKNLTLLACILDAVLRRFTLPGLEARAVLIWGNNLMDGNFKVDARTALTGVADHPLLPIEWKRSARLSLAQLKVEIEDDYSGGAGGLAGVLKYEGEEMLPYQKSYALLNIAEARILELIERYPNHVRTQEDTQAYVEMLKGSIEWLDKSDRDRPFWRARAQGLIAYLTGDPVGIDKALLLVPATSARLRSARLCVLYFKALMLGRIDGELLKDVNVTLDKNNGQVEATYARRLLDLTERDRDRDGGSDVKWNSTLLTRLGTVLMWLIMVGGFTLLPMAQAFASDSCHRSLVTEPE